VNPVALPVLYCCAICGNLVEKVHDGGGGLICCNVPMSAAGPAPAGADDIHAMELRPGDSGLVLTVGGGGHPATQRHYLRWAALYRPDLRLVARLLLGPGVSGSFAFPVNLKGPVLSIVHCSAHGLFYTIHEL